MVKPIVSLRDLARRIGVPIEQLRALAADIRRDATSHYSQFNLSIGKDKTRPIRPPKPALMAIQRRIVKSVLAPLAESHAAHGGIRGRSPKTNASAHLGQATLVTLDVRKFFDNVDHRRVYRMFRDDYGFGHDVARLLTRLTTLRGSLPQGGATSLALANAFLAKSVDEPLEAAARGKGLCYTRFVDDLALSGHQPQVLINEAARLLSARGLKVNKKKVHAFGRGIPQVVTGLQTNNSKRPTLPRKHRDAVRAAIHQLKHSQLSNSEFEVAVRSVKGRIAHVNRFHPGCAVRLAGQLSAVLKSRQKVGTIDLGS